MITGSHIGGIIALKLSALALFVGIIFVLILVAQSLDKKKLKKWTAGLLAVGLVGLIACSALGVKKNWKHKKDPEAAMKETMANFENFETAEAWEKAIIEEAKKLDLN